MKVIDAQVSTDVIMEAKKRAMERFLGGFLRKSGN